MTKELIARLRTFGNMGPKPSLQISHEAADLIEAQQKRIKGLERKIEFWRDKAKDQTHLAAAQKRIELYEHALKASWPEGAMGDAFDYWNAARKEYK